MNFADYLKLEANLTKTENGQAAYKTTISEVLSLFGMIGSLRTRPGDVLQKFSMAFSENPELSVNLAFYARDIRGGLGERNVFRLIITWLAVNHTGYARKIIHLIPEYGRWDDMYSFVGTELESLAFSIMWKRVEDDLESLRTGKPENISLIAKWLKSINTSSRESKRLGELTALMFGISHKAYRKILSDLRRAINVTEVKMSKNGWTDIKYSAVPSRAHMIYSNAFERHDLQGYSLYKEKLASGQEKINSSTLFPYDIMERVLPDRWSEVLQAQWDALPNYVNGNHNVIVMADTSDSMKGRPMATSVGLAIYFSERNTGIWKNKFMTFSEKPTLQDIGEGSLVDKLKKIDVIVANTNLGLAMLTILSVAEKMMMKQEDLPEALVVISDMEIDSCTNEGVTFHYSIEKKYQESGYRMPTVIYWNVDSRHDVFHANGSEDNVILVSGQSPSVFKSILNSIGKNAYQLMCDTLLSERYSPITKALK
jgi:hypothetical protein